MRTITDEMVKAAMEEGWSEEDAKRGYGIFVSDYGNGATHIERLDCMNVFDGDLEAGEQAEKDGIKIIRDMKFDDDNIAAYIDTPENREKLRMLMESNKRFKNFRTCV